MGNGWHDNRHDDLTRESALELIERSLDHHRFGDARSIAHSCLERFLVRGEQRLLIAVAIRVGGFSFGDDFAIAISQWELGKKELRNHPELIVPHGIRLATIFMRRGEYKDAWYVLYEIRPFVQQQQYLEYNVAVLTYEEGASFRDGDADSLRL